ncbi:hypothetical protein M409DRAFT_70414 [Zasmidium cellare ATCC 36951]|uniref:Methyltransferase type 11 domain-containing protein n=1 Tax=Zasmidium cellare ATCC 36951 TaxID=1080233 RepID=A0A6A6C4Y4_ZASCE|nr:uncharacterized protein M409DRAFT_70414 [Zasmidium cellare ATCC 36951]KAF2160446.1 hypothetical protein M409DRAFT_70414 [Zasmidium cellare ATCC 36951]
MSTSTSNQQPWPVKQYIPRHQTWPYNPSDFTRQDNSPDDGFYSAPRFVTHIDDLAIASLREYYDHVLPRKGKVLDFCSRRRGEGEVKVVGMGMNAAELERNPVLDGGRILHDLNADPDVSRVLKTHGAIGDDDGEKLDASTNVVSTDYLTSPVEVLHSLLHATKPGGRVHLTISNRCFPTKAIGRWLRVSEEERVQMVGDFLWFAGWRGIEIVELSDGGVQGGGGGSGGLKGFLAGMGMRGRDPVWVVRAVKEG